MSGDLTQLKARGAVFAALIAMILAPSAQALGGNNVSEEFHRTVTLNANGRVSLENINGNVEITGWDKNEVQIEATGETNMMYQIVGRHYESWQRHPAAKKPLLDVSVAYDRTRLSTKDLLKAKAGDAFCSMFATPMSPTCE